MNRISSLIITLSITISVKSQILTSEVKVEQTGNITSIDGQVGIGTTNPFQKLSIQDGQVFLGHSTTNQFESGRIRFSEYTNNSYQGGFIHYDGDNNIFNFGVHQAGDTDVNNDINAISIRRTNGDIGIGTSNPFKKIISIRWPSVFWPLNN